MKLFKHKLRGYDVNNTFEIYKQVIITIQFNIHQNNHTVYCVFFFSNDNNTVENAVYEVNQSVVNMKTRGRGRIKVDAREIRYAE